MFQWKLSPVETAGVVGVGLGLAYAVTRLGDAQGTPRVEQATLLLGGTALYTAGVVIGANRPAQGWQFPPLLEQKR